MDGLIIMMADYGNDLNNIIIYECSFELPVCNI